MGDKISALALVVSCASLAVAYQANQRGQSTDAVAAADRARTQQVLDVTVLRRLAADTDRVELILHNDGDRLVTDVKIDAGGVLEVEELAPCTSLTVAAGPDTSLGLFSVTREVEDSQDVTFYQDTPIGSILYTAAGRRWFRQLDELPEQVDILAAELANDREAVAIEVDGQPLAPTALATAATIC